MQFIIHIFVTKYIWSILSPHRDTYHIRRLSKRLSRRLSTRHRKKAKKEA
jgi:hypothetical protein